MIYYKQLLLILATSIFFTITATSQTFSEIGIGVGTFQYQGDLTKNFPILEEFNFAGTIFYRHNFNSSYSAKAQFSYGMISGNDFYSKSAQKRNTDFRSTIAELSLIGQVNLVALIRGDRGLDKLSPYLFAGVSGFYFNPQGKYQGEWYDLQPLGTEGQGLAQYPDKDMYSRFQVSIPFGVDIRYNLSRTVFTGFELGMRKTFTDYLDDVSGTYADNDVIKNDRGEAAAFFADPSGLGYTEGRQRGNSKKKDWYSFFNVYFTYNLLSKRDWRYIKKRGF